MSGRERLDRYLNALRRRLRGEMYARTFAACTAAVLIITCATLWRLELAEFAPIVANIGRVAIIAALAIAVVALLWTPLRRLRRDDGAQVFEARMPAQRGRIQTYLDSQRNDAASATSPLVDLLADDAATIADQTPVQSLVPTSRLGILVAVGGAAALALTLLMTVGPAHWGFGSRYLLLGAELPRSAVPVRSIVVEPGDATVRRNSDLAIRAAIEGFHPAAAQVFVRFADQQEWERAPMQAVAEDGSRFEFKLYAVRGPLSYYVDADGARSAEHTVGVVDLPKIERVRLTYSYPEWTGLEPAVDDEVRDIHAVAGTNVKVEVFADAPLESPALIIDGASREIESQDRLSVGAIDVQKPGRYQIGARVADEFVALTDEYMIEITPDEKPVVEIRKPGRDWRATSIEEVPVRIEAQDDFRLRAVELRYSVNGGEWRSQSVGGGAKTTDDQSLLRLEELGAQVQRPEARLEPGDLISYYAVAKDRRHTAQTDLFMVQVQPFERRFTQGQGGGAGGGMGDDQGAISERQREILLATWNLQRNDERNARTRAQLEDSAKMLAELQATLAQQARTLAERTRARTSLEDERIKTFVESLDRAAAVMDPAAKHLSEFKLADAVPVEQQALQQLLRAESAFRDVQVSMEQGNSSGAGAQNSRNFTEMFELEMDLEKNQYESESQIATQSEQQELDEAIRKLKELAERQEKLANEAQRSMQAQEQRWKQEQLRREAEDLRRRLAEMNRQENRQEQRGSQSARAERSQKGSQSQGENQGESEGESEGEPGEGTSNAGGAQGREIAEALASVNKALEDMRAANERNGADPAKAGEAARKAGQNLRRALKDIDQPAPSGLDEELERMAERAGGIAEEQSRVESELYQALSRTGRSEQFSTRGSIDRSKAQELVESKQALAAALNELQGDMRSSVHEHRIRQPEATGRVREIIGELEKSDVMYRLNRSAAEIYYGRAREAALREGLIGEALETLERDLQEASALAAREGQGKEAQATSETLLAEVAEMRRALQAGERREASAPAEGAQGAGGSGEIDATRGSPRALPRGEWDGRGSLARETGDLGQRIRDVANRMSRGELTQAEFDALRRRANELRRLAGDPMADQDAMHKLIDQIELAALAAAPRSKDAAAARATPPPPDSPRYREAVAEYYRRLGGK